MDKGKLGRSDLYKPYNSENQSVVFRLRNWVLGAFPQPTPAEHGDLISEDEDEEVEKSCPDDDVASLLQNHVCDGLEDEGSDSGESYSTCLSLVTALSHAPGGSGAPHDTPQLSSTPSNSDLRRPANRVTDLSVSLSASRVSFDFDAFNNPLNKISSFFNSPRNRTLSDSFASPFYLGRTAYGGNSSCASSGSLCLTSPKVKPPRPVITKLRLVQNCDAITKTALRIQESMEQFSPPVSNRKRKRRSGLLSNDDVAIQSTSLQGTNREQMATSESSSPVASAISAASDPNLCQLPPSVGERVMKGKNGEQMMPEQAETVNLPLEALPVNVSSPQPCLKSIPASVFEPKLKPEIKETRFLKTYVDDNGRSGSEDKTLNKESEGLSAEGGTLSKEDKNQKDDASPKDEGTPQHEDESLSQDTSQPNMFEIPGSNWDCSACFVSNTTIHTSCVACSTSQLLDEPQPAATFNPGIQPASEAPKAFTTASKTSSDASASTASPGVFCVGMPAKIVEGQPPSFSGFTYGISRAEDEKCLENDRSALDSTSISGFSIPGENKSDQPSRKRVCFEELIAEEKPTNETPKSVPNVTFAEVKGEPKLEVVFASETRDRSASVPETPVSGVDAWASMLTEWICYTCFLCNEPSNSSCVECFTPKPDDKPEQGEPRQSIESVMSEGGWECYECFESNKPENASCVFCDASKPDDAPKLTALYNFGLPRASNPAATVLTVTPSASASTTSADDFSLATPASKLEDEFPPSSGFSGIDFGIPKAEHGTDFQDKSSVSDFTSAAAPCKQADPRLPLVLVTKKPSHADVITVEHDELNQSPCKPFDPDVMIVEDDSSTKPSHTDFITVAHDELNQSPCKPFDPDVMIVEDDSSTKPSHTDVITVEHDELNQSPCKPFDPDVMIVEDDSSTKPSDSEVIVIEDDEEPLPSPGIRASFGIIPKAALFGEAKSKPKSAISFGSATYSNAASNPSVPLGSYWVTMPQNPKGYWHCYQCFMFNEPEMPSCIECCTPRNSGNSQQKVPAVSTAIFGIPSSKPPGYNRRQVSLVSPKLGFLCSPGTSANPAANAFGSTSGVISFEDRSRSGMASEIPNSSTGESGNIPPPENKPAVAPKQTPFSADSRPFSFGLTASNLFTSHSADEPFKFGVSNNSATSSVEAGTSKWHGPITKMFGAPTPSESKASLIFKPSDKKTRFFNMELTEKNIFGGSTKLAFDASDTVFGVKPVSTVNSPGFNATPISAPAVFGSQTASTNAESAGFGPAPSAPSTPSAFNGWGSTSMPSGGCAFAAAPFPVMTAEPNPVRASFADTANDALPATTFGISSAKPASAPLTGPSQPKYGAKPHKPSKPFVRGTFDQPQTAQPPPMFHRKMSWRGHSKFFSSPKRKNRNRRAPM